LGRLIYNLQLRPCRTARSWDRQWDERSTDLTFWIESWRRFQVAMGSILVGAVAGLALFSHLDKELWPSVMTRGKILLWLLTCTGLFLLAEAYYLYKCAFWLEEGIEISSSLRQAWRGQTAKVLLFLSVLTWLLPPNFQAVGWRGLVRLYTGLVSLWPKLKPPVEMGSLPPPAPQAEIPVSPGGEPGLLGTVFSLFFFLLLIFLAVVLVSICLFLLGSFLYHSLSGEIDKLRGLPKGLVRFYLLLRRLWASWRQKSGFFEREGGAYREGETTLHRKRKTAFTWGKGFRALVRRGYYRLLTSARQQGLPWRASQTPKEIGMALTSLLPEEEETVKLVTDLYEEARYGPVDPDKEKALRFERRRRALQKRLGWTAKTGKKTVVDHGKMS
jgi:hypothetical protein